VGGGRRRRLYFRRRRQHDARCPGGQDRRQSALPSRTPPRELTSTGMRQEVDIRLRRPLRSKATGAAPLSRTFYCHRGQMENLIKLHKAQLASDRMSCHSATANQVRLALHTAAFWLMHGRARRDSRRTSPFASAEFATIRERLIKIGGARDRTYRAHSHSTADELPGGGAVPRCRARPDAVRSLSPRGLRAPTSRRRGRSSPMRCTAS